MVRLLSTTAGLLLASAGFTYATSPCAQVGLQIKNQTNSNNRPTVPAQLAYDCITSVPFNQSAAIKLMDNLKIYWKWQSTTRWLANPPQEYVEKLRAPVDIWARFEEVRNKAAAGLYKNEYEFGFDLHAIPASAYDTHFSYTPDSLGSIFEWNRPVSLVSISSDGNELPKIYAYEDVLVELLGNNTWTPSHITHINDEDAVKLLENEASKMSYQDKDSAWNTLFYNLQLPALQLSIDQNRFAYAYTNYPGAWTNLTFANGTTRTEENSAHVLVSFDGISDGNALYQTYFVPKNQADTQSNNSTQGSNSTDTSDSSEPLPAPGYPPPIFRSPLNYIGGYYLDGEYSDVAVLSAQVFWEQNYKDQFSGPAAKYLDDAKKAGKKKIIVDLSGNAGGFIALGLDLFKVFFPHMGDYSTLSRYLASESTALITEKFSEASGRYPNTFDPTNNTLNNIIAWVVGSTLNYHNNIDGTTGKLFQSWEEQQGPVKDGGVQYSNLYRWRLDGPNAKIRNNGHSYYGYDDHANYTGPQFAPEDITIVTDGTCASTCHTFVDLMSYRAGVKVVALGGRPREGLTQALGGTKGIQSYSLYGIQFMAQLAINNYTTLEEAARLNKTELGQYWDNTYSDRLATYYVGLINFADAIREGDETHTPQQFVYQPADCRILYTKNMIVDITNLWKAVADSAWGGKDHCIAGSLASHHDQSKATRSSLLGLDLSVVDETLTKLIADWRISLKVSDYPLQVRYKPLNKLLRQSGNPFGTL